MLIATVIKVLGALLLVTVELEGLELTEATAAGTLICVPSLKM